MTLNGEIVPALTNWQALALIAATLLACAGWLMLQRAHSVVRCSEGPVNG